MSSAIINQSIDIETLRHLVVFVRKLGHFTRFINKSVGDQFTCT